MKASIKTAVFSLIPTFVLLVLLESGARLWAVTTPQIFMKPLPEERRGLTQKDPLLFWSIKPNLDTKYEGAVVRTNSLGLRSEEVREKRDGEFRILSLGESTTFGSGVANEETYSDRLQHYLELSDPSRSYTVLNAGTPAHSSFQFLNYLTERSLPLKVDMVLLYSELNDYLPASVRDSSNNEIGITMSDRELFTSNRSRIRKWMETYSAFYRAVTYSRARASIRKFQAEAVVNPLTTVGIPDIGLGARALGQSNSEAHPTADRLAEPSRPTRVFPSERRENLQAMANFCEEHNIRLVIIHPSYKDSRWHSCLLTEFCEGRRVPMIEAQGFLHPSGVPGDEMFLDDFHPTREGHDRLGRGLSERILKELAKGT
jgi:lysophospholipase L1-like esterase